MFDFMLSCDNTSQSDGFTNFDSFIIVLILKDAGKLYHRHRRITHFYKPLKSGNFG